MHYIATITVRFESESGELTLYEDIEPAIWEAFKSLADAERIDSASHVDVEIEEEEV